MPLTCYANHVVCHSSIPVANVSECVIRGTYVITCYNVYGLLVAILCLFPHTQQLYTYICAPVKHP